jgi:hypothetical protein
MKQLGSCLWPILSTESLLLWLNIWFAVHSTALIINNNLTSKIIKTKTKIMVCLKPVLFFLRKGSRTQSDPKSVGEQWCLLYQCLKKKSSWTPFRLVFFWERTSGTAFLRIPSQKYRCLKQTSQSTSYLWHFLHASWEVTVIPFPSINVFLTVSVLAHFSKRRDKWNMWHNKEWWCLQRAINSNIQYLYR